MLALAAGLAEDGPLFVVQVHERLSRRFNRTADGLHLEYGFEFEHELDEGRHVRPPAPGCLLTDRNVGQGTFFVRGAEGPT